MAQHRFNNNRLPSAQKPGNIEHNRRVSLTDAHHQCPLGWPRPPAAAAILCMFRTHNGNFSRSPLSYLEFVTFATRHTTAPRVSASALHGETIRENYGSRSLQVCRPPRANSPGACTPAVGARRSRTALRRRHKGGHGAMPPQLARAGTKAGLDAGEALHLLFANCAPADPPAACTVVANDPVGAEVRPDLDLPPGTDDEEQRRPGLSDLRNAEVRPRSHRRGR